MNGFLIDTNVVSEYTKPMPDNRVMQGFRPVDPRLLFASVVTLGEIRIGIDNLAPGRRRAALEAWLQTGLPSWFAPNILPVSPSIADRWGRLTVIARKNGTPLATTDGLIAATAFEHRLTLVTRNTSHFVGLSIQLLNPWIS